MPSAKATPKAAVTLLSDKEGGLKFVHSPSGSAEFDLKHKLGKKFTLGLGFTDNTVRKIRNIPGLVLKGDLKVNDDVTLNLAHNLTDNASKAGVTYNTKIANKKTTIKLNYLTKSKAVTGEVVSQLAPNKKATLNFNDKQVTNVKLALVDGPWTYEPSYNLVKKAPSLFISRPVFTDKKGPASKYKFGWNLKTDDLSLEYALGPSKFTILKSPKSNTPILGASFERAFEF